MTEACNDANVAVSWEEDTVSGARTTLTPSLVAADRNFVISQGTSGSAVTVTPSIFNGRPGQPLQSQGADIVTWGNGTTQTLLVQQAFVNGGTVTVRASPNVGVNVNAITGSGTSATASWTPLVTISVTGGTTVAATGSSIALPSMTLAAGQSSTQYVVPATGSANGGPATAVTAAIGSNCVYAGGSLALPAGIGTFGANGTITLTSTSTPLSGPVNAGFLQSLAAPVSPIPFVCRNTTSTAPIVGQGAILVTPAIQ